MAAQYLQILSRGSILTSIALESSNDVIERKLGLQLRAATNYLERFRQLSFSPRFAALAATRLDTRSLDVRGNQQYHKSYQPQSSAKAFPVDGCGRRIGMDKFGK